MFVRPHYNKHLSRDDRIKIEALYRQGHSKKEIATVVGTSYETIRRELKRGACQLLDYRTWTYYISYSAQIAQKDYDDKSTAKGRPDKLGNNHAYAAFIERKIMKERYSVDAALFAAQKSGFNLCISRTTLYRYINEGMFLHLKNVHLPVGKRPKKQHSKRMPARSAYRSIEQRSISRHDVGHWEMDTVVGKQKGKSHCLLVLTERHSRQELIMKMSAKTAANTVKALNRLSSHFESAFSKIFKTITMDNGSEFADAKHIEFHKGKQRTTVFYCHPFASCERGSNENANRLIRRHIPKGTSMLGVSQAKARHIQDWMNHYPRPMFKGKCSTDIFYEALEREGIEITPAILEIFPPAPDEKIIS